MTRWAPLSGIAFAVLWVGAFFVLLVDEPGDSDAEILTYYADDGNRGRVTTGAWLILFACLFFIWFLAVLRCRLARAEERPGPFTAVGFGAGLVASGLWLVADVFFMGIAYTVDQDQDFKLDPQLDHLVSEMGYLLFVFGSPAAGLVVLATSLLGLKAGVVPRWLGWLGFPIAALMILTFLFVVPFLIFLAWVLVVSIVFIWKPAVESPSPAG